MKNIINLLFALVMLSSCLDETEMQGRTVYEPVDVDYSFTLAVNDHSIMTRSIASNTNENSIYDLNAFVFDATTGMRVLAKYFAPSDMSNLSMPLQLSGTSGSRIFAFIANLGTSVSSSLVTNLTDLNNLKKTMTSGTDFLSNGRLIMSAITDAKLINIPSGSTSKTYDLGIINLQRLTAKVTVVVDKKALESSTLITVRSIQLKNVPMVYNYIAPNAPTTSTTTFVNGDNITVNDGNLEPVDPTGANLPHNYATPLYMVENMQGTRAIPTNVPGEECTSSKTQIPLYPALCSYVEVICEYRTTLTTGERDGLVTYRVYLGTGIGGTVWNNFDVKRNIWYQVTLTLTGRGGADEVSWRIVTDLVTHSVDYPLGKGGYAYTIDPSDSRFWGMESPYENTLVAFASSNANIHPENEYSEGRGVTYLNGTAQNMTAIRQCWRLNGEKGITLDNVTKTIYFLPSQNQIQMVNVFFNARTFPTGLFWSSTQLNSGTSNANQYARTISYTNYGEAQTYFSTSTMGYPRCLMEPDRTYRFEVTSLSTPTNPVYYPLQTSPNIKTYPYYQSGTYPVIVNQEMWNYGGTIGTQPRGVVSVSLRVGAPYEALTTNYHNVRRPYLLVRIAKSDCDKNGNPVTNNATTRYTMNWYEALGYSTPAGNDPATPSINPTRTGCNAYSERSDKKDLGTWRVPTALELTELWIMGAGVGGTTSVSPNSPYAVSGSGTNVSISTTRLPRLNAMYPSVAPLWGDATTIANSIANINYIWPGGTATTPYNLSKLYWSSTTSPNSSPTYAYALMLDFYSGDSYTGLSSRTAGFPLKKGQGLLRCVKDVTESTRYQQ